MIPRCKRKWRGIQRKKHHFRNRLLALKCYSLLSHFTDPSLSTSSSIESSNTVHNFSSLSLTPSLQRTLAKGLKFILTPKSTTRLELQESLKKFTRRVRLRHQFKDKDNPLFDPRFHLPSSYAPILSPQRIELELTILRNEYSLRLRSLSTKSTLPSDFKTDIQNFKALRDNPDIIISEADKNLGTVILNKSHYDRLVMAHLLSPLNYREITMEQVTTMYRDAKSALQDVYFDTHEQRLIDDQQYFFLFTSLRNQHHIPNFRVTPKVHKQGILQGRPITGNTNWITTAPAIYIDSFIQKVLTDPAHLPHNYILRDSKALIRDLENRSIPQNAILFSLDVVSMYTNIMLEPLLNILRQDPSIPPHIFQLITLAFNASAIHFNGRFFTQIDGLPMGIQFAVNVANYFMMQIVEKDPRFIDQYVTFMAYYKRYIDDIIGIWLGSAEELNLFHHMMNNLAPRISFTLVTSKSLINVLDTVLYTVLDHNDYSKKVIKFRLHQKDLNPYLYIPFTSSHPPHCKSGFIKGELIRMCRNNSTEFDFLHFKRLFKARLVKRGYPLGYLDRIFDVDYYPRRLEFLLDKPPANRAILPLVIRYSPSVSHLKLGKYLYDFGRYTKHYLNNPDIILAFSSNPSVYSFIGNHPTKVTIPPEEIEEDQQ